MIKTRCTLKISNFGFCSVLTIYRIFLVMQTALAINGVNGSHVAYIDRKRQERYYIQLETVAETKLTDLNLLGLNQAICRFTTKPQLDRNSDSNDCSRCFFQSFRILRSHPICTHNLHFLSFKTEPKKALRRTLKGVLHEFEKICSASSGKRMINC